MVSRIRQAELIDAEAESLSVRGVITTRAATVKLRKLVLSTYATQGRAPTADAIRETLAPVEASLTRANTLSYLRGSKVAIDLARPHLESTLVLSTQWFDRQIKLLEENLSYDSAPVRSYFETQAAEVVAGISETQHRAIQEDINEIIKSGAHVTEGKKILGESLALNGVDPLKPYQLETIFRTQTRTAYAAGQWDTYQQPLIDEIIWGYEYLTVDDDRVRPRHVALEGMKLAKNDPRWSEFWPPNGWNCRCQTVPVFTDDPVADQQVQEPQEVENPDGTTSTAVPDVGFAFNPGQVLIVPRGRGGDAPAPTPARARRRGRVVVPEAATSRPVAPKVTPQLPRLSARQLRTMNISTAEKYMNELGYIIEEVLPYDLKSKQAQYKVRTPMGTIRVMNSTQIKTTIKNGSRSNV